METGQQCEEEDGTLHCMHAMGVHSGPDGEADGRSVARYGMQCVQVAIEEQSK